MLFPADCRVCGLPLPGFTLLPVCSSCWNQLPIQTGPLCTRCGEALASDPELTGESLCRPCRLAPPAFDQAVAHGVYRDALRALLHLLKYDGMTPLAKPLGALLADRVLTIPRLPDVLIAVPVPLFAGKRRARGFNQAALLARSAVAALRHRRPGLRIELAPGVLRRSRATESQAGLTPHQRRLNVRGAFTVADPEAIANRHILLIDDIYTTGATARACSAALRRGGAAGVWVATVARAQKEEAQHRQVWHSTEAARPELPMEEDIAYWDPSRPALTGGTTQ